MPKLLVFLIPLLQIGMGLVHGTDDNRIPFQSITAEDGLSQATVNAITQDHSGFLWLGAQDGLNRFDGYDFKVFRADPENDCTLSGSWIRVVFVDVEGVIWVGTRDSGLNRFDEDTGCFQRYRHNAEDPTSLIHDDVNSIFEDSQGRLWVGTHAGLDLLDKKTGTFSRFPTISSDIGGVGYDRIRALSEDSKNILWVGTNSGLNAWDPSTGQVRVFRHNPEDPTSISHNEVSAIFEDSKGRFWVGTASGLNLLDRDTGLFERILPPDLEQMSEDMPVKSITEDRRGVLWVGSLRYGVLLIRDNEEPRWIRHQNVNPKSLIHDDVRSIFMDQTGVIWVGTDGGLSRFEIGSLRFSLMGEAGVNGFGLSNPWVWAIHQDQDDILWVGLDGSGIDRVDRASGKVTNFRSIPGNPNSLSHNRVRSIIQDHANYYWAGTDGGGLERFTCETDASGTLTLNIKHFQHNPKNPNSLADNWVGSLMEDKEYSLWVGTQGGVTRFDSNRLQSLTYRHNPRDPHSLPHNEILSFLQDRKGVIWVGTRDGLCRYVPEKDQFQPMQHQIGNPHSISHNMARCLAEDTMGNLWIGTYGGGLNRRDPVTGRFTRFQEKQGLANNVVYGILIADNGQIWVSTNRGISQLNPQDLSFKNYTTGDGLQANEFNSGAFFASTSGEMFFGGINGLNFFHPNKIVDDPTPPLIAFTRIKIDNEALNADGAAINHLNTITLKPGNHSVSFEFSALHYADPSKNEYLYNLEGFHSTWQKTPASRRFASFTNLDPGDYIFRVKASNKDGIWNPTPIQLNLKVKPPIWLTLWAKCIYVALPFLLFFLNHCRQRAITRRLEQMVSERTEQLNAKNQLLQDTQKELVNAAHGAGMAEIASTILHNAGNVLNSVNTSAQLIHTGLDKIPIDAFGMSVQMLMDNAHCLPQFLSDHPKGKQLGPFLESLACKMSRENRELQGLSQGLLEKLNVLGDIVAQQNAYISSPFHWETTNLEPVLESALKIMDSSLKEMHVTVVREYEPTPVVSILKTKLAQGLVNLIKNACYALRENQKDDRKLHIRLFEMNGRVHLELTDNGMGIDPGIRDKIFSQGFSTKTSSHGLGLHTCANAMNEMGGSIQAESRGPGHGSAFTLIFPFPAQNL